MTTLDHASPDTTSQTRTVTLRYFAWVREKVGTSEEAIEIPTNLETVAQLIDWLKQRGENYSAAFERAEVIRTALDQTHAGPQSSIADADEIAFFPPVTGG
ncbi:MAG: molybdopterin converting factor subunit 1 [Filomicrobium sp.]